MTQAMPVPTPTAADVRRQRIGRQFGEIRRKAGYTVADVAAHLNVGERTVGRWESGTADITFEAALGLEQMARWPRGALGVEGTYFPYSTSGATNEEIIDTREFDTFEEALTDMQAAEVLGLGVRLRNEYRVVDDGDQEDFLTLSMAWFLELYHQPPLNGEALDA